MIIYHLLNAVSAVEPQRETVSAPKRLLSELDRQHKAQQTWRHQGRMWRPGCLTDAWLDLRNHFGCEYDVPVELCEHERDGGGLT